MPTPAAVLVGRLHERVALAGQRREGRVGQRALRGAVAVQDVGLRARLVVHGDLDRDARAARPARVGRVAAVADHVARVVAAHRVAISIASDSAACAGRDPPSLGLREDRLRRRRDPLDARLDVGAVVAVELAHAVRDAARAREEVGDVGDAAGRQPRVVLRGRELVVGRAGDDPGADLGDRALVERAAQRAGREHVGVDRVDRRADRRPPPRGRRRPPRRRRRPRRVAPPRRAAARTGAHPTAPVPCTATVRPGSSVPTWRRAPRSAWKTPSAVNGAATPPTSSAPRTHGVSSFITARSAWPMPTSSAVTYVPPSESTARPNARRPSGVGRPRITALAPP